MEIIKTLSKNVYSYITLLLIVLKLTGVTDISWFWVFSPMIVSFVIALIIFIIAICFIKQNNFEKLIKYVKKNDRR